jgi:hypothetical protein
MVLRVFGIVLNKRIDENPGSFGSCDLNNCVSQPGNGRTLEVCHAIKLLLEVAICKLEDPRFENSAFDDEMRGAAESLRRKHALTGFWSNGKRQGGKPEQRE